MARVSNKRKFLQARALRASKIKKLCKNNPNCATSRLKKLSDEEIDVMLERKIDLEIGMEDRGLISYFGFASITVLMRIFRTMPGYNFYYERILCVAIYLLVRLLGRTHRQSLPILQAFDTYSSRTAWKWLKLIKDDGFESILENNRSIPRPTFFDEHSEVFLFYFSTLVLK